MRILIRTDASMLVATGHVMRCLTLADGLRAGGGHDVRFVCRAHPGHLADRIGARGYECDLLALEDTTLMAGAAPARDAAQTAQIARDWNADRIIVDHYGLDATWEAAMPCPVMVIDDLADRPHECDLLLDQTAGRDAADYAAVTPAGTRMLLGTRFALLRPEFAALRAATLAARAARTPRNVLISLGGIDGDNVTGAILDSFAALPAGTCPELVVVMGSAAPHLEDVRKRAATLGARLAIDTPDMARLMAEADLSIGAGGTTSWERCALGLPTLMVVIADNQRDIARVLDASGAAQRFDLSQVPDIAPHAIALLGDPPALHTMAQAAANLCDGTGTQRVTAALTDEIAPDRGALHLRRATMAEARWIWDLRRSLANTGAGGAEDGDFTAHSAWMARAVTDARRLFLIAEQDRLPVGYLRIEPLHASAPSAPEHPPGWITSVALDASARGTGLGRDLLDQGVELAYKSGRWPLYADIHRDNAASIRLFSRCNFTPLPISDGPVLRYVRASAPRITPETQIKDTHP